MEENRREFHQSLVIGGIMTLILLSRLHKSLSQSELIVFWVAVHVVSTGTVWWFIDKAKKCRDAWQSYHGEM